MQLLKVLVKGGYYHESIHCTQKPAAVAYQTSDLNDSLISVAQPRSLRPGLDLLDSVFLSLVTMNETSVTDLVR